MGRIAWVWIVGLLLASAAEARSNFLILVADDFGVDGVGVYSRDDLYGHPGEGASPGPTPTLDALAAEGVLFRNAYATPTCSSTRAATLTGRLGFRTGVGRVGGELDTAETTLPKLVAATHHSAALGKWHIGGNDVDHPIDSGFDYYAGGLGGGVGDYFSWSKVTNSTSAAAATENGHGVYATTDAVDEALARIAAFGDDGWLVWVAFNAPHAPFHVPPAALTTLPVDDGSSNTLKYEAAVEAMDTEIGRLLAGIPADVLADTPATVFEEFSSELKNGTAGADLHAGIYGGDVKSTRVHLMVGGLPLPGRTQELLEEAASEAERFATKRAPRKKLK
ncbi:MAG: sulfatase-like hydrolase/transferase, partial [Myxococcota bacterium]